MYGVSWMLFIFLKSLCMFEIVHNKNKKFLNKWKTKTFKNIENGVSLTDGEIYHVHGLEESI